MSLDRRTPLNRMSSKRRKLLPERKRVREAVLARDGRCVAADLDTGVACWGSPEGHEVVKHAQSKKGWLDENNVRALCSRHNQWVEDEPAKAMELGLWKHAEPGPVRKYEWEPMVEAD